jgi:spore coat polysaccharide biosynthesis protein SpsF
MMQARVGIVLQARFGSTRLPGKALATIGGISLLERCLRRLRLARVGQVVLATTTLAEDDVLAAVAARMGIGVYRGSADDVLGRYLSAATAFRFDIVIRATGDNPAVDTAAPRRVLRGLGASDYVCEDGLPYGGGVEAVRLSALSRAAADATASADREHVTTFVRERPEVFEVVRLVAPRPLHRPDVRVTVDTDLDLAHVRQLFARTTTAEPPLREIITASDWCSRSVAV